MARVLVVYFSRTGTTKRAAQELARALDADTEEIVEHANRRGILGYQRSVLEGWFGRLAEIDRPRHDLSTYDLVVVGSPVWAASLSSPARTFLRKHHRSMRAAAFFCTCGGMGGTRVLRQMTHELGKAPVTALVLREVDVAMGLVSPVVTEFLSRVRQELRGKQKGNSSGTHAASAHT